MKIALVLDRFCPELGGLEQWAYQYANWLSQQGYGVEIVASQVNRNSIPDGAVFYSVEAGKSKLEFAENLERVLRNRTVDIIHDFGSGCYCDLLHPGFGTYHANRRQNISSLSWPRTWEYFLSSKKRSFYRDAFQLEFQQYHVHSPFVIAVSEMTRNDLITFHAFQSDRIRVIHNGVDCDCFRKSVDPEIRAKVRAEWGCDGKVTFLLIANNLRLKGIESLLRATALLFEETFQVLVVGREIGLKYQRLARKLGVQQKVRFCGFVDPIHEMYEASDVLVHPTFYDPCSLVALEACAMGIPVITTRFNGASELMQNRYDGFVLDHPREVSQLAGYMKECLNSDTRSRVGTAARLLAERSDAELGYRQILAVYHEILDVGTNR